MENTNGVSNGKTIPSGSLPEIAEPAKPQRKKHPAHTLPNGRVVTRIWANRTHWGEIRWRVDHYVKCDFSKGGRQFSLDPTDLQDAMRGLYQAQRWIKRVERDRRRWFRGW